MKLKWNFIFCLHIIAIHNGLLCIVGTTSEPLKIDLLFFFKNKFWRLQVKRNYNIAFNLTQSHNILPSTNNHLWETSNDITYLWTSLSNVLFLLIVAVWQWRFSIILLSIVWTLTVGFWLFINRLVKIHAFYFKVHYKSNKKRTQ